MPNWQEVLTEINDEATRLQGNVGSALDAVRRKYLKELSRYTGRNVIAYYSGFLSKPPIYGIDITDEEKNGFMVAIHQLDRARGLDLILHTPGGNIATTETLVDYLKRMFGRNMRAIVPQIAMSAGTMIACACREILMGKHSNLGPVDPQRNGIPAAGVIAEFGKAYNEIMANPQTANVWQFILRQYTPSFLGHCENAVDWAKSFVQEELKNNMFYRRANRENLAQNVVDKLTDFSGTKGHDRHIHYDECQAIGLRVRALESDDDLQDLVLTVHHCYMHALMNSAVFKIIENQNGVAFIKQQQMQMQMMVPQLLQIGPGAPPH
jgi:hypothetical protein